jgi:hypothetical protein
VGRAKPPGPKSPPNNEHLLMRLHEARSKVLARIRVRRPRLHPDSNTTWPSSSPPSPESIEAAVRDCFSAYGRIINDKMQPGDACNGRLMDVALLFIAGSAWARMVPKRTPPTIGFPGIE